MCPARLRPPPAHPHLAPPTPGPAHPGSPHPFLTPTHPGPPISSVAAFLNRGAAEIASFFAPFLRRRAISLKADLRREVKGRDLGITNLSHLQSIRASVRSALEAVNARDHLHLLTAPSSSFFLLLDGRPPPSLPRVPGMSSASCSELPAAWCP